MINRFITIAILLAACFCENVPAQQTVFNVPTADIMDKGKTKRLDGWTEFDASRLWRNDAVPEGSARRDSEAPK